MVPAYGPLPPAPPPPPPQQRFGGWPYPSPAGYYGGQYPPPPSYIPQPYASYVAPVPFTCPPLSYTYTAPGGQYGYPPHPPTPAPPIVVPTLPDVVTAPAANSDGRLSPGTRAWMRKQTWYHDDKTPDANWKWYTAKERRKQKNATLHHRKDVRKAKKALAKEEAQRENELENFRKGMEEKFKRDLEDLKREIELETAKKEKNAVKEELEAFKQQIAEEKKQLAAEKRERVAANREGQFGAARWPTMQETQHIEGPAPRMMIEPAPTGQGSRILALRSREALLGLQQQLGQPSNPVVVNVNMPPYMPVLVSRFPQGGSRTPQPHRPITQRSIRYLDMDVDMDMPDTTKEGSGSENGKVD
ncbi:MAG: hypothetical protein Q9185_002085 [Variospora sp. 1 TL-2023]